MLSWDAMGAPEDCSEFERDGVGGDGFAQGDIGRIVSRLADPRDGAADVTEVYGELRALAAKLMRSERGEHTLQATALVHEAYVRLVGSQNLEDADRLRFLDAAAVAMRRVLVDHARKAKADKRGGEWERVTLQGVVLDDGENDGFDLLGLQDALAELEVLDPRAAKIVELRFFAGLTGNEIADHLDVSRNTVVRELTHARAWLARRLEGGGDEHASAEGSR